MVPTRQKYKSKNKFNFASASVFPIQIDDKLTILSLEISEHGKSGGVIFIQTQRGSFVLKANNEAPSDFFFNQLALSLDVSVPMLSTLGCYEPEFQSLVYQIQKYSQSDQILFARMKTKLDFPFYQLVEYIPSISLSSIDNKKYGKYLTTDYKFYSIGICLGFDMVINNNDRYAFVWRGNGNGNNVLVEVKDHLKGGLEKARDRENLQAQLGDFVYIDHDGHMVNYEDQLGRSNVEKYMNLVSDFQLNMIQYLRKQNSFVPQEFQKLINQISFYTQYKYSDEQIVKISEGIVYCTKKFINLYESGQIKSLHESIQKPTNTKQKNINYWNEYWNNEFKRVNLNFCQLFYIKMSAIYTTYPELINQIFQRVRKSVQANKNNRRRRMSQISRKSSKQFSNDGQADRVNQDQDHDQQQNDKDKLSNKDEQESQDEKRKRKWREKLELFKKENYN